MRYVLWQVRQSGSTRTQGTKRLATWAACWPGNLLDKLLKPSLVKLLRQEQSDIEHFGHEHAKPHVLAKNVYQKSFAPNSIMSLGGGHEGPH